MSDAYSLTIFRFYRENQVQNFGISAALATPFDENGNLNIAALGYHAKAVLDLGADRITVFGTTGEGPSIGREERLQCLDAIIDCGVVPDQIVVGLGATSIQDLLAQADGAADRGLTCLLVPPPFYFKDIEDAALFEWYSVALKRLSVDMRVILYHIPQVTGIPLSVDLVRRLQVSFPTQVVGIKDSSGSWANTEALLNEKSLAVLVGDERQLAKAASRGCAGAISGLANVVPYRLRQMLDTGTEDAQVNMLVEAVDAYPVTPAIKTLVSLLHADRSWRRVRPPFSATPETALPELHSALSATTRNQLTDL